MELILFRRLLILLLICVSASLIEVRVAAQGRDGKSYAPPRSERTRYNFNSDWKLFTGDQTAAADPAFDDSAWKAVTTPHAWNEDSAFR
jgi:beta-galactosidase